MDSLSSQGMTNEKEPIRHDSFTTLALRSGKGKRQNANAKRQKAVKIKDGSFTAFRMTSYCGRRQAEAVSAICLTDLSLNI